MGLNSLVDSENHFDVVPRYMISQSFHCNGEKTEERALKTRSNVEDIDVKGRSLNKSHLFDGGSEDVPISYDGSPGRKSLPSRFVQRDLNDTKVLKRGSMYQSSSEIRRMLKVRDGRRNIMPSLNGDAFLSFEIIDSSPMDSSGESVLLHQKKEGPSTINVQSKSPLNKYMHSSSTKSMDLLDLSFRDLPGERSKISISSSDYVPACSSSAESLSEASLQAKEISFLVGKNAPDSAENMQVEEMKFQKQQLFSFESDANIIYEKDVICILPKSLSAKVVTSSPSCTERDVIKSIPKIRFSQFRKMLDPITKSKSLCNPALVETDTSSSTVFEPATLSGRKTSRKSLLNDFSKATHKTDNFSESGGSRRLLTAATSPAHLHAILKLEGNHGGPSYEFSVKGPEDVLAAKTWKTENAFNWIYTFHGCKRKSNNSTGGTKDRIIRSLPIIGQMQVSCYLCSEVSETGSSDNSAVTEFVLYNIAQARRSLEERTCFASDSIQPAVSKFVDNLIAESPSELNCLQDAEKQLLPVRRNSCEFDSDPSCSYPWAPADLNPSLEIAAAVVRIPFDKKEALRKDCVGESNCSASAVDLARVNDVDLKVVTPSGTHGVPNKEEGGPSSLLDRWRFGGGCDCGGWDMGCPIVIFDTASRDCVAPSTGSQQLFNLFVKGKNENLPALHIEANGNGLYAVDFHAQLSALQAFSICIAVLHSSEASSAIAQGTNKHSNKLCSNNLKLLFDEQVKNIIHTVIEEKRKAKKRVEPAPPSFSLSRPFSPIARA
ncbi:hypothetical protein AXF42_Ash011404 [Apostasia shenzhenica]|uniref:Uncharacterized protein n=1 Tax=Apostasia shenzhenica TaxID=1088818 RepID=A0A2I0AEE4_9ASPA|nr:hypothetical protein AXF42_Ash011404 [Apostasia shenzhenica]